jgi:hypothetical protein
MRRRRPPGRRLRDALFIAAATSRREIAPAQALVVVHDAAKASSPTMPPSSRVPFKAFALRPGDLFGIVHFRHDDRFLHVSILPPPSRGNNRILKTIVDLLTGTKAAPGNRTLRRPYKQRLHLSSRECPSAFLRRFRHDPIDLLGQLHTELSNLQPAGSSLPGDRGARPI